MTTVLIVEDDEDVRTALAELLHEEGYDVKTALEGQSALTMLKSGLKVDLIVLDWMMPVMDGREFLLAKNADPSLAGVPVLLMSALAQRQEVAGAAYTLQKPVEAEILLATVKKAAGRT